MNTDARPTTIIGGMRRTPFGEGAVEERIAFHGGQAGNASFLGLNRVVRSTDR